MLPHWSRLTLVSVLLLPVAALFALLVRVRRLAYARGWKASYRMDVPVIVVGNITAGGSGKTPFVIWLVKYLVEQGWKPGVVSRGYGGRARHCVEVRANSDAAEVGDEPLLIHVKTHVPVVIGRDRVAAARLLRKLHPDVDIVISDDGLQHYRLQRDLELAIVDAGNGYGNGLPLPAGPLREPRARLASVDAVVHVYRSETAQVLPQSAYRADYTLGKAYRLSARADKIPLANLPRGPWRAVTGIGHPQGFYAMLTNLGWQFEAHTFPDHHAFTPRDIPLGKPVVMTEKDAVKCEAFAQADWWAIELEVQPEPKLITFLQARMSALVNHRPDSANAKAST